MNICDRKGFKSEINKWGGGQIYNILRNSATFQNFTDFYSACDKNVNICDKKLKI